MLLLNWIITNYFQFSIWTEQEKGITLAIDKKRKMKRKIIISLITIIILIPVGLYSREIT